MNVALVYDRINKWGGAERVLLSLHKIFPKARLYTSVYHPKKAKWAKVFPKIETSFINKIEFLRDKHELIPFLMPFAFQSFDFSNFDLVISVTSEFAKTIKVKGKTKHLSIILTPTRYLWSEYKDYFDNRLVEFFLKPLILLLKYWDKKAAKKPHKLIAISNEVKKRIKRYYDLDSVLIYPPFSSNFAEYRANGKGEYFLIVSRLVKYKKVDLMIRTFNELGLPLVIVGTGRDKIKLKAIASKNIKFVGEVTEKKLISYYKNAKALMVPQLEDFGLIALEAQAMGLPVIAYKKGGIAETVIEGKTGIFFDHQTVASIKEAVSRFDLWVKKYNPKNAVKQAKKFSEKAFKKNIVKIISNL